MKSYIFKLNVGTFTVYQVSDTESQIEFNHKRTENIHIAANTIPEAQIVLYSVLEDTKDINKAGSLDDFILKTEYSESEGEWLYNKMKQHQELVSPILLGVDLEAALSDLDSYLLRSVEVQEVIS